MVVAIITGLKGDGKSSLSTMFAHNAFKAGRPVFSNYHLEFHHELFYMSAAREDIDMLQNAMVVIDEAYLYIDSRNAMAAGNKVIGYLTLQTRKRGVDLILNLLQKGLGDLRIRENADYIYNCEAMTVRRGTLKRSTIEDIEAMNVDIICVYRADVRQRVLTRFLFNPAPYFKLFDTREFVDITA